MPAPEKTATGQTLSDCASRPLDGAREAAKVAWTPGPWRVRENGLAGYGDNGANFFVSNGDGRHNDICALSLTHKLLDYGETPRYLEARANARLIAAAPCMYEALAHVIEAIEHADSMNIDTAKCRAALSRARGE
jgi:hypothetical protein